MCRSTTSYLSFAPCSVILHVKSLCASACPTLPNFLQLACLSTPAAPADEKHGNGADTYLHRVGRAGRFGTKGLAITFVASPADSEVLNQVQVRTQWRRWPCPQMLFNPWLPQLAQQSLGLAPRHGASQRHLPRCLCPQERFDVDIKPLPEHIDASTYMNAA